MIPQIIKHYTKRLSNATSQRQMAHSHSQTTTKLSFYGLGNFIERLGMKTRSIVAKNPLGKRLLLLPSLQAFAQKIGFVRSLAPWELQFVGQPKATWGAHSKALMRQSRELAVSGKKACSEGELTLWGGEDLCANMVVDKYKADAFPEDLLESESKPPSVQKSAPKMIASRVVESHMTHSLSGQEFVEVVPSFVAVHKVIDTESELNKELVIIGAPEDAIVPKSSSEEQYAKGVGVAPMLRFLLGRNSRQVEEHGGVRGISVSTVGVFAGLLLCLFGLSSYFFVTPYIDAEIRVQNLTLHESNVTPGIQILSYENRLETLVANKAEFDSGQYSSDQFEVGHDDLEALPSNSLILNHYGDNAPDLSVVDWWDDDGDTATNYNWRFRRCFEVDNSGSADDMIEYQVYLDTDTQALISGGKMLTTGADIRFVSSDGSILPHVIADDINTISTKIWVQVDEILAGDRELICMYYGNPTAIDSASIQDVFTYDVAKPIYHVVADSADGSITEFASYSDSNDITVSGYAETLDRLDTDSHPDGSAVFNEVSQVGTTAPINATYSTNGTDNIVPVSAAGTDFVYRTDRFTNQFSIISPWCNASLTFENASGNNILDTTTSSSSPFAVAAGGSVTISTNDTLANGIPNNNVIIIEEVGSDCPVLMSHHGTNGGDSYTMFPASDQWYGVGSGSLHVGVLNDTTSVTVYKSNGTTVGPTLYNRGQSFTINDTGSQGSEVAHRIVADGPIGVQARGDGDGGDAVTFLPAQEMGYRYYIADVSQYIAIATAAGIPTTVDLYHDGTACGVGIPDDTTTVSPTGNFPGKVYFGLTSGGDHIPAGACIVASNPIYAYNEYSTPGDEHNIWNEKQNAQFVGVEPTYVVGSEEVGSWSIDGINTWIRRVPVTITNNATTPIDQYQISLEFSTDLAIVFGKTQNDGGDIRLAGALGDGTDNVIYAVESFDVSTKSGTMWMQSPMIAASANTTVYVYYSPIGIDLSTMSPRLWLDAADSTTIVSSLGSVSAWNDKSGTANNMSQATLASQPMLSVDGTQQVIAFNGDFMTDTDGIWGAATYSDTYVFSAFKNTALIENGILFGERIQAGRYEGGAPQGTNAFYQPNKNSEGSLSGVYVNDITNYHTMRFEAHATATREIYRDNVVLASDLGGVTFKGQNREFSIGGREDGSLTQSINMGEIIVFTTTLTATQINSIESYLSQKWVTGPTTTLSSTGDYSAIWQTSMPKPNYYIVDERSAAIGSLELISFADANTINFNAESSAISEGEMLTVPIGVGISQGDVYTTKGPLHIGFDADSTDAAVPIGYAGKEFVTSVGRDTDIFSFYSPYVTANVQIQGVTGGAFSTLQTVSVPAGTTVTLTQDIINNTAFKIISDEPILAFHRNGTSDSKILYPVEQAFVEASAKYEIYGVPSGALLLGASTATTVDIYRSDGTSSLGVVIDGSTDFSYTESGSGIQGTALGYRITSDDPIGASSYADSDGGEAASFVSQKEFSSEYIVANPTQYMSIVTRDPSVECRVYDASGIPLTTGPATMDNIPPQTAGTQTLPYPNRIHIGGDDTADGAYFSAGYRLECDEPVYAYYEHHLSTTISDETSWLTWPQGRTRNYSEPLIADLDSALEEGLYYESGFTGSSPVAIAQYIFDTSTDSYGRHTYWRDITWDESITDRGALNSVQQIKVESAYADSPNCATATYSSFTQATDTITLSTVTDSSPPFHDTITNTKRALLDEAASDHDCLKIRLTLATGDAALTPTLPQFTLGYYVPEILEGQLSNPQIDVIGTVGALDQKYRIAKAITSDPGLANSQANLSFRSVSDATPFASADFELLEMTTNTPNPQFTFPAFPGSALEASTASPLDASNQIAIYYTGQRTAGTSEQINMTVNVDIAGVGGPSITRDFILEVEG